MILQLYLKNFIYSLFFLNFYFLLFNGYNDTMIRLETKHLILRQWKEDDLFFYANLTSNKQVMKFFPKLLNKDESDKAAKKFMGLLSKKAWGFWVVEEKSSGKFLGYAGLHAPQTKFPFSPCVEIGWRMYDEYWNNGYVEEAGEEILKCAFDFIGLSEIVYFSSVHNLRAQKLVQKLGMQKEEATFNHPFVEIGHHLSEHYLYKIKKI